MTARERLTRALGRDRPDRVPMFFSFTPALDEEFERRTGAKASEYQDHFCFAMRSLEPKGLVRADTRRDDGGRVETGVRVDEWGIGYRRGSLFHFEEILNPLRGAAGAKDIERYPFPSVDTGSAEYASYVRKVEALHGRGYAVVSCGQAVGGTLFWPAYKLRGLEQVLVDMHENPALLEALLDRVEAVVTEICLAKVKAGVDVILLADDFGTQIDLMMSLESWDRWFRAGFTRIIAKIKAANPGVFVAFHSDGAVEKLIPRFLAVGVEVLNPVQPECMDIFAVKRRYGDRLSFWGTIGTQTTMPFGTPDDVDAAVRRSIEEMGRGGGLLLAPTHVLEPEVPWENILAFVGAVEKYGRYA